MAVEREQAEIGDSNAATARTVRRMLGHIVDAANDSEVARCVAESQVFLPAGSSNYARAWCWWHWIRSHVRFISDQTAIEKLFGESDQLELLVTPPVLVRMLDPQGDCDDFTMLCCAGLVIMGVPCQVVTIAAIPFEPSIFSHVFARAEVRPGVWLSMDTSHGSWPGWEVPADRQFRRVVWDLDGSSREVETMSYNALQSVAAESVARQNLGAHSGVILPAGSPMPFGRVHVRRRGMGDAVTGETSGAPASWSDVFKSLAVTGGDILRQQLAPLNPGEYVQTASGVRSRDVPGAIPGQYPGTAMNLSTTGSMMPILLLGGVGLVLFLAMGHKGR